MSSFVLGPRSSVAKAAVIEVIMSGPPTRKIKSFEEQYTA